MAPAVDRLLDRFKAAFWKALLSDKVRPFVWLYYIPLFAWGIYGTFFAGPATYVLPAMGNIIYDLWVWTHIVATAVVMTGLRLEDVNNNQPVDRDAGARDKLAWIGLCWQTAGHGAMFAVLFGYELAAIHEISWGQGVYSIFVTSPYVIGCCLLCAQGLARLFATEKVRQYLDRGGEL